MTARSLRSIEYTVVYFSCACVETRHHALHIDIYIYITIYMGVDLKFLYPGSVTFAKKLLSPNFRLPAFYLSPKYVVFMCAMYVVFCSRQWLLLCWQTQNRNFTVCQHVSST